ncbi:fimbrial biogenesis outer membrane usher protein [Rahnella perminowiae]|uniref:fimbria/pilus outer membrane usher protein n=1 Tax=Rahnella perminowiae TaxID=2816244 RepID=UPI00224B4EE8|nr:fimbria/pilus outer membrane usher protein [Rahnella perminowiae]MCX2942292.1 fimbrial biogenesis outer membrane usher protein [Rahnella perminowiae]
MIRLNQASRNFSAFIVGFSSFMVSNAFCETVPVTGMTLGSNIESKSTVKEKKAVRFNNGFMVGNLAGMDLSAFDNEELTKPGDYHVDVKVNGKSIGVKKIKYVSVGSEIQPCLTKEFIYQFDIDTSKLHAGWDVDKCILLSKLIPSATFKYDSDEETLEFSIPQVSLLNNPEGYVNPALWDNGVPSLAVNYSLSATNVRNQDHTSDDYYYGNALSSLKLGAWRFYTFDSVTKDSTSTQWDHISAYTQRAIAPLKAEMKAGDINTTGELFNTVSLRGVSLATDERMLPDSLRGYAPVIRGVADTNAKITIRQNGNVLKELTVPPGEFEITDLYATGYGGDLEVTITEATGQVRTFITPYSSVPMLLRPGQSRFSTTVGEIRNDSLRDKPLVLEGTYQYGLTNQVTAYTGFQTTEDNEYSALMAGAAVNTPIGALGADITRSFTSFEVEDEDSCDRFCNMSLKLSLAKFFNDTGTNLSLAGYRYSSKDYYSLSDALLTAQALEDDDGKYLPINYRDKVEINISQNLIDGWGNVYLSGYYGRAWDSQTEKNNASSYQFGYSNSWYAMSYNINFSKTIDEDGDTDDAIYLSMSVPFGTLHSKVPKLNASVSYSDQDSSIRTALNGTAGEYNQMSYGGWINYVQDHQTNAGINLGYSGSAMQGNIGYSQTETSFMTTMNASGGIVLHEGGVNYSSALSDTFGIVEAKGATGSHVYPDMISQVSENGYAIISSLNPYQYNDIYLDTKGADMEVEVDDTKASLVPTAGASVKLSFKTKNNINKFLLIKDKKGVVVPYGAMIKDSDEIVLGIVGQGGRAMVAQPENNAEQWLTVSWSEKKNAHSCRMKYIPDEKESAEKTVGIATLNKVCE